MLSFFESVIPIIYNGTNDNRVVVIKQQLDCYLKDYHLYVYFLFSLKMHKYPIPNIRQNFNYCSVYIIIVGNINMEFRTEEYKRCMGNVLQLWMVINMSNLRSLKIIYTLNAPSLGVVAKERVN